MVLSYLSSHNILQQTFYVTYFNFYKFIDILDPQLMP